MNFLDILIDKLAAWYEHGIELLPNLIAAIIIFLIFALIARLGSRAIQAPSQKIVKTRQLKRLLERLFKLAIYALGIFVALNILNLDKTVTSFLAGLGVAGLALGFAFQDIASNFIAGVILSLNTPFKLGDIIETSDSMGTVKSLGLRTTNIHTFDGQDVLIPNKDVLESVLVNYTRHKKRRVDVEVGVGYDTDLRAMQKVATDAVQDLHSLDKEPIEVLFHTFADSSINASIRFWITSGDQIDYLNARSEAVIRIQEAFKKANIDIPYPIRTLQGSISTK